AWRQCCGQRRRSRLRHQRPTRVLLPSPGPTLPVEAVRREATEVGARDHIVSRFGGTGVLMAQSESERYRAFAEDCFALAQTLTAIQRAHFLEMSAAWHKLAQHQERLEAATNKNVDQQ